MQSLLGDEDTLSLATMDDHDPDSSVDEFGSGYRGFSAQSSSIRYTTFMILLKTLEKQSIFFSFNTFMIETSHDIGSIFNGSKDSWKLNIGRYPATRRWLRLETEWRAASQRLRPRGRGQISKVSYLVEIFIEWYAKKFEWLLTSKK